jgi:hypothetical protein
MEIGDRVTLLNRVTVFFGGKVGNDTTVLQATYDRLGGDEERGTQRMPVYRPRVSWNTEGVF